jgi:hypothetical protein
MFLTRCAASPVLQGGEDVKIRIPSDIDQELRKLAAANTRTLAAQVLHYIKQGMANEKT